MRRRQPASFVHSRNLQRGSGHYFYPVRPVELRGMCYIVTGVLNGDNIYSCVQNRAILLTFTTVVAVKSIVHQQPPGPVGGATLGYP